MHTIKKQIRLECAHLLPLVEKGHPCGRLHGHSYVVTCTFSQSDTDFDGNWVTDFTLPQIKKYDHTYLNDFMDNPTAENLAKKLFDELPECVVRVEVCETVNSSAVYEKKGWYK